MKKNESKNQQLTRTQRARSGKQHGRPHRGRRGLAKLPTFDGDKSPCTYPSAGLAMICGIILSPWQPNREKTDRKVTCEHGEACERLYRWQEPLFPPSFIRAQCCRKSHLHLASAILKFGPRRTPELSHCKCHQRPVRSLLGQSIKTN